MDGQGQTRTDGDGQGRTATDRDGQGRTWTVRDGHERTGTAKNDQQQGLGEVSLIKTHQFSQVPLSQLITVL